MFAKEKRTEILGCPNVWAECVFHEFKHAVLFCLCLSFVLKIYVFKARNEMYVGYILTQNISLRRNRAEQMSQKSNEKLFLDHKLLGTFMEDLTFVLDLKAWGRFQ